MSVDHAKEQFSIKSAFDVDSQLMFSNREMPVVETPENLDDNTDGHQILTTRSFSLVMFDALHSGQAPTPIL